MATVVENDGGIGRRRINVGDGRYGRSERSCRPNSRKAMFAQTDFTLHPIAAVQPAPCQRQDQFTASAETASPSTARRRDPGNAVARPLSIR